MSRSFRHTPVYRGESSKVDKVDANRLYRSRVKQWLRTADTDAVPEPFMRELSDTWTFHSEYRFHHFSCSVGCAERGCWWTHQYQYK